MVIAIRQSPAAIAFGNGPLAEKHLIHLIHY
jgi:hypothetical protein